jgi:hypothetical protein
MGLHFSSQAAPGVLCGGNWFQVVRVHAVPVAAEVIQVKTLGNWADVDLVGHAVRKL